MSKYNEKGYVDAQIASHNLFHDYLFNFNQ